MLDLRAFSLFIATAFFASPALSASSQAYNWQNVKIGGGGGFVPGIVFNPSEKGLAYARTDIGGAYKLNSDDTWTPLLDFVDDARWDYWGVDALATDPVETNRLYLATGMYTNSWDPNNGHILISTDYGSTFTASSLPFKVGGNMPGRGMGERLVVDPNNNAILFFGARSGNGLYKSTNYGSTWSKVSSLPSAGTYVPDPTDTTGYNSDIIGISWVTFDSTSGSSGFATPRIFVGVANQGSSNIFVSENGGSTWSAVAGQNTTYIPHKGVLSPDEHVLYISYSNGAGPYDGTLGSVYKYNISASTWTDITPVSGSDLYFGFGGLSVDLQKPGTLMVAALNSWWPDGQIYRSTDSGATWSPFWAWNGYPNIDKYYTYSDSLAPWLGPNYVDTVLGDLQIGWMMESLSIDPFDSDHFLYGTGATIYGSHDLTKWDTTHNITLESLADRIEETSVQGLISPPSGPHLLSAVGDIEGFVHNNLNVAPSNYYTNPTWTTTADIDYAGNNPTNIVRIGTGLRSTTGKQVAISTDSGATWSQDYGAADNVSGGKVAFSADGDTVLWRTSSNGVQVSQYTNNFTAVSSLPSTAVIASDKLNNSIFYGAASSSFYLSTDGGKTFSAKGSLGSSTSPVKIAVNPNVTGDVWVSTDSGLFHSSNLGSSFSAISGISQAWAIALGAPASTGGYPAVFAAANYGGIGYFRSDDAGVSWVQINDASHGFGSTSANCLAADPRIYGRVYIGTNGRGIFYGDASGTVSSPTATASTTTAISTSTTATKPVTTASTSTTSASTPTTTSVSGVYEECGGIYWTGPTACISGYTCTYINDYYSQCLPS
ncbi:Oligoxyloglucan reducing end-specific cellobiohydrolase [Guyanagaster necrorhizus]|uniref:Oligoxyloglucan reducing end-specific cellobiohydrolase n=1 Tax=Guyanagaster necrorhizus TaxID=856835 RepID=A0A9P7W0V2_9AGAR|nr:Oligoxyloglucan reducing end-specific cellobiohydrolase [Guyanagaster necrorhizus MCA 3950]KAG7450325.1 Oligoxyloglucan reducing end-specific cellobiohydrolase [Guyanagaster necrorhizus MCA 3950]